MGERLATFKNPPTRLEDDKTQNKRQCTRDNNILMSKPADALTTATPARRTRSKSILSSTVSNIVSSIIASIVSNKGLENRSSGKHADTRQRSEGGAEGRTSNNLSVGKSPSPVGSGTIRHACPSGTEQDAAVNVEGEAPDAKDCIDAPGLGPPSSSCCQATRPPQSPPSLPQSPPPTLHPSRENTATSVSSEHNQHRQQHEEQTSLDVTVSSECDHRPQDKRVAATTSAAAPPANLDGFQGFTGWGSTASSRGNRMSDIEKVRSGDGSNIESVGFGVEGGPGRIHRTPPSQVLPFGGASGPPIDVAELLSGQALYVHDSASRSLEDSSPFDGVHGSPRRGAAMQVEQSPELPVIRRGFSSSFDSNRSMLEPQGYHRDSMVSRPCALDIFTAPASNLLRGQGRVTSFDANSNDTLEAQLLQMAAECQSFRDHQNDQQHPQPQQDFFGRLQTPHGALRTAGIGMGSNSRSAGQDFRVPESHRTPVTFGGDGSRVGASVPLFQLGTAASGEQHHQHGPRQDHRQDQQQRLRTREQVNAMVMNTVLRLSPEGIRNPDPREIDANTSARNDKRDSGSHDGRDVGGSRRSEVDRTVARPRQGLAQGGRSLEDDRTSAMDTSGQPYVRSAKKRRSPYRCKQCGQLKNSHRCPFKNIYSRVGIRTLGSQTDDLAAGTVFEPPDLPVPSPNGENVFYSRPYYPELTNHDPETGPFQHPPMEVTAEPSVYGTAAARSGHGRSSQPENYNSSMLSNYRSEFGGSHRRFSSFGCPLAASLSEVTAAPAGNAATREGVSFDAATGFAVGVPPPSRPDGNYPTAGLGSSGRGGGDSSVWSNGPNAIGGDYGHGSDPLDDPFLRYTSESLATAAAENTQPAPTHMALVPSSEALRRRRSSSGISIGSNSGGGSLHLPPDLQALENMFYARWAANASAGLLPRSDHPDPQIEESHDWRGEERREREHALEPQRNHDDDTISGGGALDTVADTCSFSTWRASAASEAAGRAQHQAGGSGSAQDSGRGAGGAPCVRGAVPPPSDLAVERTDMNDFSV